MEAKLKQFVDDLSIASEKYNLILEWDSSGGIEVLTSDRYYIGHLYYDSEVNRYQYNYTPNLPTNY